MGLFGDVGRKFEKTKQAVTGSTDAEYVCGSCEQSVAENHEHCPHCGAASVEPVS